MSEAFTPTPEEVEITTDPAPDAPVDTTTADVPDAAEEAPTAVPDNEDDA